MPMVRLLIVVLLAAMPHVTAAAVVQLPETGQLACYSATGSIVPCSGTGQDGEDRSGVAWPVPRFTDNGDGTVIDHLTDLIWLKNAGCIPDGSWNAALAAAGSLRNGQCGLTDRSVAGSWRLPNVAELESLVSLGAFTPAVIAGHPFTDLHTSMYWTSSTHAHYTANAWSINFYDGTVGGDLKSVTYRVLPVRGGR